MLGEEYRSFLCLSHPTPVEALSSACQPHIMPVPLPAASPKPAAAVEQQGLQPHQEQPQEPPEEPGMTAEQFQAWQAARLAATAAATAQAAAAREAAIKAGSVPLEHLTGRELHEHHPELFEGH